jgi:hypothetical protein
MLGYRLLIFSMVLTVPLSAIGLVDSVEQEQELSSDRRLQTEEQSTAEETSAGESAPADEETMHHHHHEHPMKSGSHDEEVQPPSTEASSAAMEPDIEEKPPAAEKEDAAAAEETHHHHHKHPTAGDTQLKPPPAEEGAEEHIHHEFHHEHHMMVMDAGGMVMNENKDDLPRDCPKLAGDVEFTVRAGTKYAKAFPGTMFGYDQHEWKVEPCTRVTVTLINEDDVRHQWMMHMLPKYIYPQGMFHLEVAGQGRRTGTFIVPSEEKTYFVHCDIAQHTEKGMKAQLKVGRGDQDFPSIPGITAPNFPDSYETEFSWSTLGSSIGAGVVGLVLAIVGWEHIQRRRAAEAKAVTLPPPPPAPAPEPKRRKWWPFT